MDSTLAGPAKPKFRDGVSADVAAGMARVVHGGRYCTFAVAETDGAAIDGLFTHLRTGGLTVAELASRAGRIGQHIPQLLEELDSLRLLTETDPTPAPGARSGAQLYREVVRVADRTARRAASSAFYERLVAHEASRQQLIGYALEYYSIVLSAPGLIGPALGGAHGTAERTLLQDFLRSELGHDRFLAAALTAVGVTAAELAQHVPLPATFALCAALGVYGRQHLLSFKACLFLFERSQPAFVDAFDDCCRARGLPAAFYGPLRAHADLNDQYDHADISRALLELDTAIDAETCAVVKRHVALMVETLIEQERQILDYYGKDRLSITRIFA